MRKTYKGWEETDYSEEYLKVGDTVDAQIASRFMPEDDVEDAVGFVRAEWHETGYDPDKPKYYMFYRESALNPWTYSGAVSEGGCFNEDPHHAKKIFISCPIRRRNADELLRDFTTARNACMEVIRRGNLPIMPRFYFGQFLRQTKPELHDLTMEYSLYLLEHCDEMIVIYDAEDEKTLTEDMEKEVAHAVEIGLEPIFMSAEDIAK